jgi:hypothetical protein
LLGLAYHGTLLGRDRIAVRRIMDNDAAEASLPDVRDAALDVVLSKLSGPDMETALDRILAFNTSSYNSFSSCII